jgi:hypothetical protein
VGPAILVGLLAAAVIGLFNGLCLTRLNMSAFVPTLATLSIVRSLALIIPDSHPDDFKRFTRSFGSCRPYHRYAPGTDHRELARAEATEEKIMHLAALGTDNVPLFARQKRYSANVTQSVVARNHARRR